MPRPPPPIKNTYTLQPRLILGPKERLSRQLVFLVTDKRYASKIVVIGMGVQGLTITFPQ